MVDEKLTQKAEPVIADEDESAEPEYESGGMDDKLDVVFKALSDMQGAIRDLASAVSAGQEAQQGYEETLNMVKSLVEAKKLDVGARQDDAASKTGKNTEGGKGEPAAAPGAEKVTISETKETAEYPYEKREKEVDIVKSHAPLSTVVTDRAGIEVKKGVSSSADVLGDLVSDILKGNVKPYDAGRRAYEMIGGK